MNSEFLLTSAHAIAAQRFDAWVASVDARLAAKQLLRPDRQAAALKGVHTKREARA